MTASYQVALSFAGEDRSYVREVAAILSKRNVRVFYDEYGRATLWGKNLYDHLQDVYRRQADFTVMFVSRYYAEKVWPNHERQGAQARALEESREYVLPARFDDTEVPGLLPTIGYIDLRTETPQDLAELIIEKIVEGGGAVPHNPRPEARHEHKPDSSLLTIYVENLDEEPVQNAHLLIVSPNKTYVRGFTTADGKASIQVPVRRLSTLYCAHVETAAYISRNLDPVGELHIRLPKSDRVGSVILPDGSGTIPRLSGRLNPIRDTSNRLYLYANNIAINGGRQQPVAFKLGVPLHLEDSSGEAVSLTIVEVIGHSSLLQYSWPAGSYQ